MKLLSINRARSVWLLYLVEFNRDGRSLMPLIPNLVNKYKFEIFPNKPEDQDFTKSVEFKTGIFKNSEGHDIDVDLTVFNDGVMADTRSSTGDSDSFLDDLLTGIVEEFGFVPYKEVLRRKSYVSELLVQTDKVLNTLNPKLKNLVARLTALTEGYDSQSNIEFETSGISFWAEPDTMNYRPVPFRFERFFDTPFSENRYYSVASLQTHHHIETLNELEELLSI